MYDNTTQKQQFASRLIIRNHPNFDIKHGSFLLYLQRRNVLEDLVSSIHHNTNIHNMVYDINVSVLGRYQLCLENNDPFLLLEEDYVTMKKRIPEIEIAIDAEVNDAENGYITMFSFYLKGIRYPNIESNTITTIFYKSLDELVIELKKSLKLS